MLGRWSRDQLVEGFRRLANQQMADAVRSVSIKQGADPREHLLVGFGGAAGQHICEIAEALGMGRIVDHPDAGLLSALGMGLADQRLESVMPVYQRLADVDWPAVGESQRQFSGGWWHGCGRGGVRSPVATELAVELRYQGTDATLAVPVAMESIGDARLAELPARLMEQFSARHRQLFDTCGQGTRSSGRCGSARGWRVMRCRRPGQRAPLSVAACLVHGGVGRPLPVLCQSGFGSG